MMDSESLEEWQLFKWLNERASVAFSRDAATLPPFEVIVGGESFMGRSLFEAMSHARDALQSGDAGIKIYREHPDSNADLHMWLQGRYAKLLKIGIEADLSVRRITVETWNGSRVEIQQRWDKKGMPLRQSHEDFHDESKTFGEALLSEGIEG